MSSIAWVYPAAITSALNNLTNVAFNGGIASVTSQLWLDDSNNFTYARSAESAQKEIWPALYEKAYAKFAMNDRDSNPLPEPNMGLTAAQWGTPGTTPLGLMMPGWNVDNKVVDKNNSAANLNQISAWCAALPGVNVLKFPAVAWSTADPAMSHTFSILGIYNNNIVIRDPLRPANAPAGAVTGVTLNLNKPSYNHGAAGAVVAQPLILSNGTYGVSADYFKANFYGYGRVY